MIGWLLTIDLYKMNIFLSFSLITFIHYTLDENVFI